MNKILLLFLILAFTFSINLHAQLPANAADVCPLLVGETFPDVLVKDLDKATISFHEIIKEKPAVVIFYRGGWCPYCNRHLSAIGQVEAEILELGYQIVAISPDKAEKLQETAGKGELNYHLFSDGDGELSSAAGIAFQAPERYTQRLLDWSNGENTGFLPVPSVFILGANGEIMFEYINPNYKKRLTAELLLAVLKAL